LFLKSQCENVTKSFRMLKKIILTWIVCLVAHGFISAQNLEIIPQINYSFGSRVYGTFGELKIQDSESYGVTLSLVNKNTSVMIEYYYQPTTGVYRDYFMPELNNQTSDLRINWYQIGIRQRFGNDDRTVPFAGLSVGVTDFNLDSSPNNQNETAFCFGLQAGANIYLSDRVGIRFHGRLNMPLQFNGFGFYAGTGGSGASASASAYFVQADVGAGLIFRLSN